MNRRILLLVASFPPFLFCNICLAVIQEPNLQRTKLCERGSYLTSSSVAEYDSDRATLLVHLNVKIPMQKTLTNTKTVVRFKVSLDHLSATSSANTKFQCGSRIKHTPYFDQLNNVDTNQTYNFSVVFDHVYSGMHQLKINRFEDSGTLSRDANECENHINVSTDLSQLDVDRTNISVRLSRSERGVNVDFLVTYNNNSSSFLTFEKFEVLLYSSFSEKYLNSTVIGESTAHFAIQLPGMNCSENTSSMLNCQDALSIHFNVSISPLDSRCNYPTRSCVSSKRPCKRNVRDLTIVPPAHIEKSTDRNRFSVKISLMSVWIPLLVATIVIVLLAAICYTKHSCPLQNTDCPLSDDSGKDLDNFKMNCDETRKVLLVYDMNDKIIEKRASLIRSRIMACGITTVYDFCDPDQQEDINILGPIHWFNRVINHPEITQIVVIQSSGTDRCFEQFVNEENCSALTDDSDGLLRYVLHQLIEICSRNDINPYHRLFIAVFSDIECAVTHHNYLTPFRCFILPDHMVELMTQLLDAKHSTKTHPIDGNPTQLSTNSK